MIVVECIYVKRQYYLERVDDLDSEAVPLVDDAV